jgi:hypothetical protein
MQVSKRAILLAGLVLGLAALFTPMAGADTVGPITFENYALGNINGQQGWSKTGPYDVEVESISSYPAAAGYGFGTQALRSSDFITSGSFGDQTFSPGLSSSAGETGANHFESTFWIGTTQASQQLGLHMSVSPDDGNGARMSYLRFEDQFDGVHVFFDDVTNPGPFPMESIFNETDIATLSRTSSHSITFSIDFAPGPGNDSVAIYIDGVLEATGTTWEDYYRYDPEAAAHGGVVPRVSKMLFRESGAPGPLDFQQGFLIDNLSLSSSTLVGPPTNKDQCKNGGWQTFNNPTFRNQGECVSYTNHHRNG